MLLLQGHLEEMPSLPAAEEADNIFDKLIKEYPIPGCSFSFWHACHSCNFAPYLSFNGI
jgi:hypothetical protein